MRTTRCRSPLTYARASAVNREVVMYTPLAAPCPSSAPTNACNVRPSHWGVGPLLRLDVDPIETQRVLVDHAVDSLIAGAAEVFDSVLIRSAVPMRSAARTVVFGVGSITTATGGSFSPPSSRLQAELSRLPTLLPRRRTLRLLRVAARCQGRWRLA